MYVCFLRYWLYTDSELEKENTNHPRHFNEKRFQTRNWHIDVKSLNEQKEDQILIIARSRYYPLDYGHPSNSKWGSWWMEEIRLPELSSSQEGALIAPFWTSEGYIVWLVHGSLSEARAAGAGISWPGSTKMRGRIKLQLSSEAGVILTWAVTRGNVFSPLTLLLYLPLTKLLIKLRKP